MQIILKQMFVFSMIMLSEMIYVKIPENFVIGKVYIEVERAGNCFPLKNINFYILKCHIQYNFPSTLQVMLAQLQILIKSFAKVTITSLCKGQSWLAYYHIFKIKYARALAIHKNISIVNSNAIDYNA